MLLPMMLLALVCFAIGVLPSFVSGPLQRASLAILPMPLTAAVQPLSLLAPLPMITLLGLVFVAILSIIAFWYRRRLASAPLGETSTWGCGYQRPSPAMQYSASSFAQMLTDLFTFVLKPEKHIPAIPGVFPPPSRFHSHVPEAVLELLYIPALKRLHERFSGVRQLQSGLLNQYVLYILLTLIVLFLSDY